MSSKARAEADQFLKDFVADQNLNDVVNLKVGRYSLLECELHAEVVNWTLQYLSLKKCPRFLVTPIVRQTAEQKVIFLGSELFSNGIYDTPKVTQLLTTTLQAVCSRLLDSENELNEAVAQVDSLPITSECSDRNRRRSNEDRFVNIPDLNGIYEIMSPNPLGFYAVFDGHGGISAASYSTAHLPCTLASNLKTEKTLAAISNAFNATDIAFLKKCEEQKIRGGTTAVCALYEPNEMRIHVSWAGDSKALLSKRGELTQIVRPHVPNDPKESQRIKEQGGSIMFWGGILRVNGALAISRAIGNYGYKPYITSEPETELINLDGDEDFLILSSDGLWDVTTEENIASVVYTTIRDHCEEIHTAAERLVSTAKVLGASDNVTVLVIFLKDPQRIADEIKSGLIPADIKSLRVDVSTASVTPDGPKK